MSRVYCRAALNKLLELNDRLRIQHQKHMTQIGPERALMKTWNTLVAYDVFNGEKYDKVVAEYFPPPRPTVPNQLKVEEFINELGWSEFRENLCRIMALRLANARWHGKGNVTRAERALEKVQALPRRID